MAVKIDSNVTGLRYAEESTLKVLPGSPVWFPLEPNKYTNFGGKLTTIARKPISQSRQQQKGTVTDLTASGAFEQDLTQLNTLRLMQGFLFADAHEKATTMPLNTTAVDLGSINGAAHTVAASSGLDVFTVGDLVFFEGFSVAGNNGLHSVTAVASGLLTVSAGLSDEADAPAAAKVTCVGHQFVSGDLSIVMAGGLPRVTSASVTMSNLRLTVGEWIYIGGDIASTTFSSGGGFARIRNITAAYLELDKTDWVATGDAGTGKTIQLYFGTTVKNEADPNLIKRRTYQIERTLGADAIGVMSEYLIGACANEFTLNVKTADKVTAEMAFVALDNEQRNGTTGIKVGIRPPLSGSDPFNTSSDFSRIKMALVSSTDPAPTALFAYATDISIKLSNSVTDVKAIGTLGGFDTVAGNFVVDGKITAYFADVAGVQAVRNNADVTLDICMVKKNAGYVFDLPLISLGNGELQVVQDKPIELPLDMTAAQHPVLLHTFLMTSFAYLPSVAG
jgi:hypothetical protein